MVAKCIGEKSASYAELYVNTHLGALWETADKCFSNCDKGLKASETQKYSFALAEYSYGEHSAEGDVSEADMMFYASFGKPRIEFICSHNAIIHLTLKKGHYSTDYEKATGSHVSAAHERNRPFNDVHASFRVSFSITGLRGKDGKIGGGSPVIKLFIFDFQKAQTISIESGESDGHQALSFYLLHYLRFLSDAGYHVLSSLPNFDDNLSISIASTISGTDAPIKEIHGISVEKINNSLSMAWLTAAMLAASQTTSDDIGVAFAEYHHKPAAHGSDVHFYAKMGAPRVQAICDQEVILYFTIDHLDVYDSDSSNVNPRHSFQDWEIAVLVNVVTSNDEDGNVSRCRLDFKTWHCVQQRCKFPGLYEGNAEIVHVKDRVVEIFTSEYFAMPARAQRNVIYHHDQRWFQTAINHNAGERELNIEQETISATGKKSHEEVSRDDSAAGHGSDTVPAGAEWQQISETVDMGGFDQIMAISQGGIIAHFLALWNNARTSKEASLIKWSYEDFFEATFKPMTLRLLSNGRAIVWIHLQEGFLRTLRNWLPWSEGSKYSFENWSLAFEVDIRICDHSELPDMASEWHTKFESSHAYEEHGQQSDRVLKHFYLDFRSAEFVHEFSSFEGLFQSSDKRPIDKVQAIVTYIRNHYFHHITSSGYHILNTMPVWNAGSTPPSCGLTSIAFHVYCKQNVTHDNWGAITGADEPLIVLLGMTGFRPLPSGTVQFSANWIAHAIRGVSNGLVSLSKRVLMEKSFLTLLARVNALTTIVPLFADVDNDAWSVELTTYAKHEKRKDRACSWVPVNEAGGILKYKWEHRDEWSYSHEGSDHIANGDYTLLCVTKNYLHIPTTFNRGVLEIKLEGNASVSMSYKGVSGAWNTQSSAKWSTTLAIKPDAGGLRAEVIGSAAPVFSKTESLSESKTAMVYSDPETLLKAQLPGTTELNEVVGELKNFEGAWHTLYMGLSAFELTQPVFNTKGDLLFKLRPFGVTPQAVVKPAFVQAAGSGVSGNDSATNSVRETYVKGLILLSHSPSQYSQYYWG